MIAKTILQQIGGRRFAAMTGSKDFIDMGNGLRMSLARNKTSANRLDIIYDAGLDLYNMRFYRRTFSKKTFECKTKDIATHEGIDRKSTRLNSSHLEQSRMPSSA